MNAPKPGSSGSPFAALAALRDKLPESAEAKAAREAPPPAAKKPEPSLGTKIVIQREKKGRGGKTVTRIRGLEVSPSRLAELSTELKKSLGCGATLEGGDVVLLGDLAERAAAFLTARGAKKVVIGN